MITGKVLEELLTCLDRHKRDTLLIIGDSSGSISGFLYEHGFKVESLDHESKNGRDIDISDFRKISKTIDDRNDIGFILSADGGACTNLTKLLAMKYFYRDDILDFFKQDVRPYKILEYGILITSLENGEEDIGSAVIEDSMHHFIHGYSDDRLRPSFCIRSDFSNPIDDMAWMYLTIGMKPKEDGKVYPNPINPTLRKIRHLSRVIMSKMVDASRGDAMMTALGFVEDTKETTFIRNLLEAEGFHSLELPESLKTKLESKG